MSIVLKPCPDCGKTKSLIIFKNVKLHNRINTTIICDKAFNRNGCGYSVEYCESIDEAIKLWNSKHDSFCDGCTKLERPCSSEQRERCINQFLDVPY